MRYINRRAVRVLLSICWLCSLNAGCEKGAAPSDAPNSVSSPGASVKAAAAPVKQDVTPQEAKSFLDSSNAYVYLDVRTVAEFTAGHVPGSINVPFIAVNDAGQRGPNESFLAVVQAALPKDAKIIVGCQSGGRSKRAQGAMKTAGYSHLSNMLGGFGGTLLQDGWSSLDYPVEAGDGDANSYASLRAKAAP